MRVVVEVVAGVSALHLCQYCALVFCETGRVRTNRLPSDTQCANAAGYLYNAKYEECELVWYHSRDKEEQYGGRDDALTG